MDRRLGASGNDFDVKDQQINDLGDKVNEPLFARICRIFSLVLGSIGRFFTYLVSFVTWNRSRDVVVGSGVPPAVVARNSLGTPEASLSGEEEEEEGPLSAQEIKTIRNWVQDYPFQGYKVSLQTAESCLFYQATQGRMVTRELTELDEYGRSQPKLIQGIGYVVDVHAWEKEGLPIRVPDCIIDPAVRLPEGKSFDEFNDLRQLVQRGVVSEQGIKPEQALRAALFLSGMTIEATMPYRSDVILRNEFDRSYIHYIFQSWLNFGGTDGGGIPIPNESIEKTTSKIEEHSRLNAQAALSAAIRNKSHVLVFDASSTGDYRDRVKQGNVDGICAAVRQAREDGHTIQIIVTDLPNLEMHGIKIKFGLSKKQKESLKNAGIEIITGHKEAVVALFATQGYKVSSSIDVDPMAMLGIHGPGSCWEFNGSASEENCAAYLSPCYVLGYIPIDVYEYGSHLNPHRIRALSEYMQASEFPPL